MKIKSDTYFDNIEGNCLSTYETIEDISMYKQNPEFIIVENFIYEDVLYVENEHSEISLKDMWGYPFFESNPKDRIIVGFWKVKCKNENNKDYSLSA